MYLLDTHVFLWFLSDDLKLKESAKNTIADKANPVFVSAATIWEISIKAKLKKLKVPKNIEEYIAKSGFEDLSVSSVHASKTRNLPLYHRDPFDRMLISQATLDNLTIITHDKIFKKYTKNIVLV